MWKASELKGLPRMCMVLHADCIKFSIVKLAWPIQILLSLQALLGKVFGVRTVTLTSLLYAIWNRSQDEVRTWEKEFAGDYDTCRPGSSALHAAVCRSAKAEICFWLQIHNATLLHDQEFFFDSINIPILLSEAKIVEYPVVPLCMAMQQHIAPRIIKFNDFVGLPALVWNSIIAGCGQSVPLTRAYLGRGMKRIHQKHFVNKENIDKSSKTATETYVDDCAQGTAHLKVNVLIKGLMLAFRDFRKLSVLKLLLNLSDKGAVVSSSDKITKAIRLEILNTFGEKYHGAKSSRDLGISFTAGRTRPSGLFTKRLGANTSRIEKTVRISRICRSGRKLFSGSCFSANTWGHQACGFSISTLVSLERQAAKCTGVKPEGRCRFTCLVLGYGWKSHPKARIFRETFTTYFKIIITFRRSDDFENAVEAWKRARDRFATYKQTDDAQLINTRCIHGPFSVVIAYLLYLGWVPFALNVWIDHTKTKWTIDDGSRSSEEIISAIIERSNFLDQQVAALHYGGNGIQLGMDHELSFAWHRSKSISYTDR
jgi:hypothetical protein